MFMFVVIPRPPRSWYVYSLCGGPAPRVRGMFILCVGAPPPAFVVCLFFVWGRVIRSPRLSLRFFFVPPTEKTNEKRKRKTGRTTTQKIKRLLPSRKHKKLFTLPLQEATFLFFATHKLFTTHFVL